MITTIAWIVLILKVAGIILEPLFFGATRDPYNYKSWINSIISAILLIPICLHVLGYI